MKHLLYYITFCLLSLCFAVSCKTQNTVVVDDDEYSYGIKPSGSVDIDLDTIGYVQLDSIITADLLPDFDKWLKSYVKDAEKGITYEYSVLVDQTTYIIYTVKTIDNKRKIYVIQKRKLINN